MKELIVLSRKKGFLSKYFRTIALDKDAYSLWMCELQKWLREIKQIDVQAPCIKFNSDKLKGYQYCIVSNNWTSLYQNGDYITYEEALEEGLIQALKLLP